MPTQRYSMHACMYASAMPKRNSYAINNDRSKIQLLYITTLLSYAESSYIVCNNAQLQRRRMRPRPPTHQCIIAQGRLHRSRLLPESNTSLTSLHSRQLPTHFPRGRSRKESITASSRIGLNTVFHSWGVKLYSYSVFCMICTLR